REFEARCRRLASALARRGVGRGDTVAVMGANTPALLEAHYAVPALGAVLNALNTRLDARMIAFCLDHGEARVLITDPEYAPTIRAALGATQRTLLVVDIDDAEGPGDERLVGYGGGRHARVPATRRACTDFRGDPRASRHAHVRGSDRTQHADPCAGRGESALRPSRRRRHGRRGAAVRGDRVDGSNGF